MVICTGVIKSVTGEITDYTNSSDAFAMLHVPWTVGASFGYGEQYVLGNRTSSQLLFSEFTVH